MRETERGEWGGERERKREKENEQKASLAFLARLSFRTLASPPFSRLFIIRANKVNQQAGGSERRGVGGGGEAGERAARERGDRFKQDYQTIKRISTFPGVPGISSSLTLCADEHPRGNFEEDPSERRTGTMRRILRERRREGGEGASAGGKTRRAPCSRSRVGGREMEISPGRLLCTAMKTACLKEPRRIHF